MFKALRLTGFKCYGEPTGDIPLAPLTIIVGPNNAGKSTLLHALLLFKQTIEDPSQATLVTTGPLVDAGGFRDIVDGRRPSRNRTFSIGLTRDRRDKVRLLLGDKAEEKTVELADKVDVTFAFDARSSGICVEEVCLQRGMETLIHVTERGAEWEAKGISEKARRKLYVDFDHFFPVIIPESFKTRAKVDMRGLKRAFNVAGHLSSHVWLWERLLADLHYIPPLRARIPWYYRSGQVAPAGLGIGGENLLQALSRTDIVPGQRARPLTLVNRWMAKRLKMLERLRVVSIGKEGTIRALVGDEIAGCKDVNVAAMGQGVAQVLPIIASTLLAGRRACLLIEQPELHLHPKAQADLADLFIDSLGERRQFIIETHSEHLLLRIRRRVAEGLPAKNVSVLYVTKERGVSTVQSLRLEKDGHFEEWPKGFFDEAYQEAMGIAVAGLKEG